MVAGGGRRSFRAGVFFLQTKGFILIAFVLAGLVLLRSLKDAGKDMLYYIAGLTAVLLPVFLIWGNAILINPWKISQDYWQVNRISYLALVLTFGSAIVVYWLYNRSRLASPEVSFLVLLQAGLLISVINRPDSQHILINSFPLIILIFYYIEKSFSKVIAEYRLAWMAGLFGAVLLIGAGLSFWVDSRLSAYTGRVFDALGKITAGENIYAGPFLPGLYFELKKPNPYPTSVPETVAGNAELRDDALSLIRNIKPKFALTNYGMLSGLNYEPTALDGYVRENYAWQENVGGVDVWKIKN